MANYPFKHWYAIVDGGCWEEYLIQQGIVQWKIYNKRAMDKRDAELKKS